MKIFRMMSLLLWLTLVSACSDDKNIERDLLADCENHYRATSYLVAIKTCQKAAELGVAEAQWLLANIYQYDLTGQGADPQQAFYWFLQAAQSGWTDAQTIVGEAFLYGDGVEEDFDQAYSWLIKAADYGDPYAEFTLGYMFLSGKGKAKDISMAISWFKKAASKEHIMSINNLAWIYATSTQKAFRNVKKAQYWANKLSFDGEDRSVFLDTMAAVHALAGDFVQAIELQNKAIASLPEDVEESRLLEFQKHLETYQKNQPWQE